MNRNLAGRALFAAISTLALVMGAPVLAQTAVAKAPAAADNAIPEVVVTAQKRSENVQKVPVAVTVVGSAVMKQNNITNAESLDEVVPSLEFKKGTANVNSTLSIRGIGTQSFSSGAEPSVSTVVDGVVYGRAGMAFQEFTDLDHVEVLGGPQGTLFGKNASAGAVSIVTKTPSATPGGDISFGYYEGGEYRADGYVSGPITDTLRYSLAGVYGDYNGNIYNAYTHEYTNGYRHIGARGALVDNITSDLKVTLRADWTHASDNCCADVLGTYVPNAALSKILFPSIAPVTGYFGSKAIYDNLTPGTIDSNGGASAQVDYSLGGFTLASISAWRDWRNKQIRDGDFHATCCNYVNTIDINDEDFGALNYNQFSEELRLASPTSGKLTYVVGAFLWYTHENDWFNRLVGECTASTLPVNSTGSKPCGTAPGVSTIVTGQGPALWTTQFYNQAVFGQANYAVTDKLSVIGGVRLTHDRVEYDFARDDEAPAGTPGIGATFVKDQFTDADGVSGKAGLQYQATRDNMFYLTYSRGYKGPSLNDYYSEGAINAIPIAPETSNAYELGTKSQFFNRSMTFNADVFDEEFANFQANNFVTLNGTTSVTLVNAGAVSSKGFEMMVSWRARYDLFFNGGYTYDYAVIDKYACAATLSAANLATCEGLDHQPLPFAPKNKVNVNVNYEPPLPPSAPFNLHLTSTYTYTSMTNFDISQTPLARQPPYGLWDAAALFSTKDEKYDFGFYIKNITNQYYTTFITPSGNGIAPGSYTRLQIPRDAQRYIGVKLTANF